MIRRLPLPLALTILFAAWIVSGLRAPKDKPGTLAASEFGRLPLISNGRFQPFDSLARNALLQIREKQTVNCEPWKGMFGKPKILSATEWIMEMTMNPAVADTRPVFRIDHPDLKGLLGLPLERDPDRQTDGKHFSWKQVTVKMRELQEQARRAAGKDQSQRDTFEQAVLRLWSGVTLYMKLQNTIQPQNAQDWARELDAYQVAVEPGRQAAIAQNSNKEYDKAALETLTRDLQRFDAMNQLDPPLPVPPHHPELAKDDWMKMGDALMEIARGEAATPAVAFYARMATSYKNGDVQSFNDAVRNYRISLGDKFSAQLGKGKAEQLFNAYQPFYRAMVLYALAGMLVLAFWVRPESWEVLRRSAAWLTCLVLAVHFSGLLFRMILEGRPPVTNLYSSAVFIGFGACILGLILEYIWKNGIGIAISSVCGFLTLIIAHHLALTADTMEMMRAVLDTNFWLATHVVVVTLGYSATFVAGFLAIIYIVAGVFTRTLSTHLGVRGAATMGLVAAGIPGALAMRKNAQLGNDIGKSLGKMVYGIVCFATLFSFVGTVLGGIWADQSWGRFWGWDVKENGALMIVLWNAVLLHARWGGLVRERGLMACAVFGNIITAWSWFGVNMLGIGLHSYGFMDAAFNWLLFFVGLCLLIITAGMFPLTHWKSFSKQEGEPSSLPLTAGTVGAVIIAIHAACVFANSSVWGLIVFYIEVAIWVIASLWTWISSLLDRPGSPSPVAAKDDTQSAY